MSTLLVSPYEGGNQDKQFSDETFVLTLIISLSLLFSAIISLFLFIKAGQVLQALLPMVAGLIAICGPFLTRRGKDYEGVGLAVVALAITYAWYISHIGGLGLVISVCFPLVLFTVVHELNPEMSVQRVCIGAALAGFMLLILDVFWPTATRIEGAGSLTLILYLAISTTLLAPAYSLRHFSHYRFREKLTVMILGMALLPLVITALLVGYLTRQALIKDANYRLESAAIQTAANIDDFLIRSLNSIRFQANILWETGYLNLPELARAGSGAEVRALAQLKYFRDTDPLNFSSYAILNTKGETLLEYPSDSPIIDEMGQEYITSPIDSGLPYVSSIRFTPIPGGPFVYFSAPIINESNQIVGVLRARYRANILQQLVMRSSGLLGDQSFAVVYDDNYQILAHGTYQNALYKLVGPLDEALLDELQAQRLLDTQPLETLLLDTPDLADGLSGGTDSPFFTAVDISNGDVINQVGFSEMGTKSWQVAYFQPRDDFLAPIQYQSRVSILLAVIISVMIVALGTRLGRLLSGPISRLEATASRISQGDINARALIETEDEIGSLAASLNQLSSRLQETLQAPETPPMQPKPEKIAMSCHVDPAPIRVQHERKIDHPLMQFYDLSTQQLASLNRLKQALRLASTLDDIFRATAILLHDILPSDQITAALLNEEIDRYDFFLIDEEMGAVKIEEGRLDGTLLNNAINEKRVIVSGRSHLSWLQEFETNMISPLTAGGRTFGTLNAGSRQRRDYQPHEQSLFLQVATMLATAFEDKRLFLKTEQLAGELVEVAPIARARTSELAILSQLSQELSVLSDVSSIARCAFYHAANLMQVEKLTIALHDGNEDAVDLYVFGDNGDGQPLLKRQKENGLIDYVIQDRQSLLLSDQVIEQMTELGYAHNGSVPKSWAGVPLGTGKHESDMIAIENYSQEGAFREHELELLQAVAVQISIAIKNSYLFKQEQAHARREQILREITTRVRSSTDVDLIMRTAAQEVGKALGRQTFVYLSNGDDDSPAMLAEEKRQDEQ